MSLKASSLFSLEGKRVLLTGANGFLGRTMGSTFLANGAHLIALGRSTNLQDQVATWSAEYGADRVQALQVDMFDTQALEGALDACLAVGGGIDVLVNNAHELGPRTGFNTPEGALETASMEQWLRNLTGGVYWAALTTQKLGPAMKQKGSGSIINICSMYALVAPDPKLYEGSPFLNPPGYSASKAALAAFTRYTASYWGAFGVRANALAPGPFSNTQNQGPNSVQEEDPFLKRLMDRTCLGRIGRSQELAGALLYLASDASSYMTGQVMVVDGGWTIR